MVHAIIAELEGKEIMSNVQVQRIRRYIREKHINNTAEERAVVFSNLIHKTLDKELNLFQEANKLDIKKNILREAISRGEFSLNKFHIFEGIIAFEKESGEDFKLLEKWIKSNVEDLEKFDLDKLLHQHLYPRPIPETIIASKKVVEVKKEKRKMSIMGMGILATAASLVLIIQIILPKISYNPVIAVENIALEEFSVETYKSSDQILNEFKDKYKIDNKEEDMEKVIEEHIGLRIINHEVENIVENIIIEVVENKLVATSFYKGDHPSINYKKVSKTCLKIYLENKGSILAEEEYLTAIVDTAEAYGLNPLLLIAITGQEQSFVQKSNSNASTIANNPFNVFGSWEEYNTDIYDSAAVVSRTIINLSKNLPTDMNPIKWINRKYAEDQNWWKGVSKFLKELEESVTLE